MKTLKRALLAIRIALLEHQIELRRTTIALYAKRLDDDRRNVNHAYQALAALDGRRQQSVYQLKGRR